MSSIEQQAPAAGFSLVITARAAEEVQKFIAQEQVPSDSAGLRVSVLPAAAPASSTVSTSRSGPSRTTWSPK